MSRASGFAIVGTWRIRAMAQRLVHQEYHAPIRGRRVSVNRIVRYRAGEQGEMRTMGVETGHRKGSRWYHK